MSVVMISNVTSQNPCAACESLDGQEISEDSLPIHDGCDCVATVEGTSDLSDLVNDVSSYLDDSGAADSAIPEDLGTDLADNSDASADLPSQVELPSKPHSASPVFNPAALSAPDLGDSEHQDDAADAAGGSS